MNTNDLLEFEEKKAFDFFWNEVSLKEETYGLIRDNDEEKNKNIASIASVGFGLTAIPIAIENKWIEYDEGYKRALKTLKTFYYTVENKEGFFLHFVDMNTGKRIWNSEVSVIDTVLFLMGAMTVSEYFKGEISEYFEKIYSKVNFPWYLDKNKNMFYMGYWYESGFGGHWDLYAEQLIMYILAAASPTYSLDKSVYYDFGRNIGKYGDYELVYTWTGSLFTYQYSHAWIDFRNIVAEDNINWFENSIKATLANRQFCIDNKDKYKTFNENSWGLTACAGPDGYRGDYGAPPSGKNNTIHYVDGTVPPAGALGSIVFTPDESIEALKNYYKYPKLIGKYGLKDAYNLDRNWYSDIVIGIDKGISLVKIENYKNGMIWDLIMKNKYIKTGLKKLEFKNISN